MLLWMGAAITAIYLPILNESPLRIMFTLPAVFFVPGYCLIAYLFPKKGEIGFIERLMLSFGFSIVVVPLIGLSLDFTPFGIRLDPIVIFLTLFTVVMILVAHYRRALLIPEERFQFQFSDIIGKIREGLVPPSERKFDRVLSLILALIMIVTILSTAWVIFSPKDGEHFSELYILNANLKADNYPIQIIPHQFYPIYIGIGNQEYQNVSYKVEIWFEEIETNKTIHNSNIRTMDPAEPLETSLAHGETRLIPYNLFLNKKGYNRIDFLLFKETVPGPEITGIDRINASYRNVHLWIVD